MESTKISKVNIKYAQCVKNRDKEVNSYDSQ